jgi:hypothetical protein
MHQIAVGDVVRAEEEGFWRNLGEVPVVEIRVSVSMGQYYPVLYLDFGPYRRHVPFEASEVEFVRKADSSED